MVCHLSPFAWTAEDHAREHRSACQEDREAQERNSDGIRPPGGVVAAGVGDGNERKREGGRMLREAGGRAGCIYPRLVC